MKADLAKVAAAKKAEEKASHKLHTDLIAAATKKAGSIPYGLTRDRKKSAAAAASYDLAQQRQAAAIKSQTAELEAQLQLIQVDINSVVDKNGQTVTHHAATRGSTEALELLLQHKGDPNQTNKDGDTPMHDVVRFGNTNETMTTMVLSNTRKVLQLLIQYKGDPNKANDNKRNYHYGKSATDLATKYGEEEALEVLKACPGFIMPSDAQVRAGLHHRYMQSSAGDGY